LPRQRHVAKAAQSAATTWRVTSQVIHEVGPRTFFNFFFFAGDVFQYFFIGTKIKTGPNYRDDYHI